MVSAQRVDAVRMRNSRAPRAGVLVAPPYGSAMIEGLGLEGRAATQLTLFGVVARSAWG